MAKLVSQVYGEALFELARERGMIAQFSEELTELTRLMDEYPDYLALLTHPRLDEDKKQELFEQVFAGRLCQELSGFCRILLKKGRFGELDRIAGCFEEKRLEYEKTGVAWVSSPIVLTGAQKEKIEKRLLETTEYVSMQMHYDVRPELIGGVKIRIGDRVVDSSIQRKLNDMKNELMKIQL